MQLTSIDELRYMQFPLLAGLPDLWHGVFVRHTVSRHGARENFNLGLNKGDPESVVWTRRDKVAVSVGARGAVFANQVHGAQVAVLDKAPCNNDAPGGRRVRLSGDALITAEPGMALFIQTADCQSVLIVDEKRRVIANVHSGWRGSIANVIGKTVETMKARYQCRPEDLYGAIGPSLGPCCAEFIHYRKEIPEKFWAYRSEGDLFDFWRLSSDQLMRAGVRPDRIAISGICTRCNRHLFFSYRGEGGKAGRFAAVILLKR